jgi:hypothetical protein
VRPINIKLVLEVFTGKLKPGDLDNLDGRVDLPGGIHDVDLAPKEVQRRGKLILLKSKMEQGMRLEAMLDKETKEQSSLGNH